MIQSYVNLVVKLQNILQGGSEMTDFNNQCALAAKCDVVVTNNKRDFHEFCKLPFLTSEEFLLQFDYKA